MNADITCAPTLLSSEKKNNIFEPLISHKMVILKNKQRPFCCAAKNFEHPRIIMMLMHHFYLMCKKIGIYILFDDNKPTKIVLRQLNGGHFVLGREFTRAPRLILISMMKASC